jgi:hypothetical protein
VGVTELNIERGIFCVDDVDRGEGGVVTAR